MDKYIYIFSSEIKLYGLAAISICPMHLSKDKNISQTLLKDTYLFLENMNANI